MVFYSPEFFLFLPLVFLIHHFCADRYRHLVLLLASIGFYAAFKLPWLLVALALVVVLTYGAGRGMGASATAGMRKLFFLLGISANLLVLIALKYLPFLIKSFNSLAAWFPGEMTLPVTPLLVSIGVSYFVFQAISYLIDVYLEIQEPEHDFGQFALYQSFFPKLLQGPIERAGDLLPQLKAPYVFNYDLVRSGLLLFTWGMFKKLVVADRLAIYVDMVYADVHGNSGLALLLATWLYAFQLYFDFSGYTDMALGTARLFNIQLTQNFNTPYLATSIADFWRRWHISFSRWILDYIFKPLQMHFRARGNYGTAFALIVTFVVSGIWHGANWGFIVWGLLHGLYLAISVFYRPLQKRLHKASGLQGTRLLQAWQIILTFNLVCLSWVFFRAGSIADACYIISHTFSGFRSVLSQGSFTELFWLGPAKTRLFQSLAPLAVMLTVSLTKGRIDFFAKPRWFRWGVYYLLVYTILYHSVISTKAQFVYFQF